LPHRAFIETNMILTEPILPYIPKRIVSLVPSQTELLFDLGLDIETVGITKFCVHPEQWFRSKTRVGGTKTLNIEKIRSLQPDLIIANKEENVKEQIEALAAFAPVWVSDIKQLENALDMIADIGQLTKRAAQATAIITETEAKFNELTSHQKGHRKTLYLIWQNPWMTVGADTFIQDMLERMGCNNVFRMLSRYPELTEEAIRDSNASLVLLSSEPYPFKEKHIAAIQSLLPDATIKLVDGEMFSWYGSRLVKAPEYFKTI
jgi:ABC-type Fe3+-hydroxamate transport system substrate-binding protein